LLSKHFGCTRCVFNHFLRRRVDHYANTCEWLTYYDTAFELTELKKLPEYAWLQKLNSQSLQPSFRNLDTACDNFLNKRAGFPTFKKKPLQVPQPLIPDGNRLT